MAISVVAAGGSDDGPGDRIRKAQAVLQRLGWMRFGPPTPEIEYRIRDTQSLERLEELLERLLEATSWQQLFPESQEK
jgi:hypothetical protein